MRKLLNVLPVILIVCMILTNIFAANIDQIDDILDTEGDESITGVDDAVGKVWATIVIVVQILAVAAVVFAGVRYMFASADQKANIKKAMIMLAVGAILVFCATTLLQFVTNVAEDIL